ncbi:hypothetical protein BABINDRAFT_162164 [Babjeviella inositovora NRRL Y-12698]|uniref:Glycoside hydrolase family 132 protein n=1 Tax=Babjeviella inositovora NRRL Y-12698 TaxID=984486 RepID=A0A1E3QN23_9ASCO|nr:uncharacterized protein BABINDRAFT_162164 [Babjeviella inositovora NRRL Y-12698]ODQ79099.1 hypothetical protein BABINDRAFT_162164 [Babjeviella inositovora NRRL Y-12698]
MKYSIVAPLVLAASVIAAPANIDKRAVAYVTQTVIEYVNANGKPVVSEVTTQAKGVATSQAAATTSQAAATTSQAAAATTSQAAAKQSSSASSSGISGDLSAFSDPTTKFEDGVIACSDFPSGQGVIGLDWLGFGGWSSIMNMQGETSTTCKDGYYCSYACQAGMSKTQWPSEQPSNGISVGGLYCKGGYLYKASDSDYLCEWGQQSASFVSEIDDSVAICRTDYPGSENMVVPTWLTAGSSQPASVVNSDSYYVWQGGKTSAQYYVNNAGVSLTDGCVWGTDGSGVGNWAPVVIGAGYTGGVTWLSLIPNPNNKEAPNYNLKIVASDGATVVGNCKYENGVYTGGTSDGCTVSVTSGVANFVFY